MDTQILYLDAKRYPVGGSEKLPGIRRYCATRKWGVTAVYRDFDNPGRLRERLPSLLAELRPAGCIVESSWADGLLPPGLFGAIPVVYLDYQGITRLDRPAGIVACDNEAATRMAFRELSVNLPPCYRLIPHFFSADLRRARKAHVSPAWLTVPVATVRASSARDSRPPPLSSWGGL